MLTLRPTTIDDMDLYFQWVNDPEVRRNALNPASIELATHQRWFAARLADEDTVMFVVESDDTPVGQLRFDIGDERALISYSLDERARGKGLGKLMLSLGIRHLSKHYPQVSDLDASVVAHNVPSIKTFQHLGFAPVPAGDDSGIIHFHCRTDSVDFRE